jgi:VanZ family protein
MQKERMTFFYRFMLGVALCATTFLATTSARIPVAEDINDKISHIAAFYALSLLVDFSWPKTGFRFAKALWLLGYGIAIEAVQYFLPHRSFSLFDLGADAVGMVLFWFSVPLLRKIYPLSMRFKIGGE